MSRAASANKRRTAEGAGALRSQLEELAYWVTTGTAQRVNDRPSTGSQSAGLVEMSNEAPARQDLVKEFVSAVEDLVPGVSKEEMFRSVATRFAKSAEDAAVAHQTVVAPASQNVSNGWQELLAKSLKYKIELLDSSTFRSVTEAGAMLHLGDDAIRRRIREKKLLALTPPGGGEFKIPGWALDLGIAGATTSRLYQAANGRMDDWELFHFMSTPLGSLNGMLPFELLLSSSTLRQKADFEELLEMEEMPARTAPLDLVCAALEDAVADRPA
ncbi:MAG: hypothetical protein V4844_16650 [Pseudomonadota bacterium]